uniref:Uncharacterized protein n=1 Tax=Anguilla anguilla TaxID=7936 RepID=A0A0E9VSJ0_ANGAN
MIFICRYRQQIYHSKRFEGCFLKSFHLKIFSFNMSNS